MTLSDKILHLLSSSPDSPPTLISAEWVKEMLREHPAFILPGTLLVKRNPSALDDESLRELKLHLLLNCSDPTALSQTVDLSGEDWANFYPSTPTPESPSTDSAISTFLDAYGSGSDSETALLEQLIFNPAPADYFAEDELQGLPAGDSLLPPELLPSNPSPTSDSPAITPGGEGANNNTVTNVTISSIPEPPNSPSENQSASDSSASDKKPAQKVDESLLSESLAKIFIKQQRYERAFEIISNLSLNFPEKSVYFADQMRFLQKLIKNRQYLQQNK